jgi:hypothetical protein
MVTELVGLVGEVGEFPTIIIHNYRFFLSRFKIPPCAREGARRMIEGNSPTLPTSPTGPHGGGLDYRVVSYGHKTLVG